MNAQRIEDLDRIERELSERLIPARGKADTVGGELLRAIERMIYRYFNDGDVVSKGYGIETCMSSYLYLEDKLNELGLIEVTRNVWSKPECDPYAASIGNVAREYSDDDKYQDALYQLLDLITKFIYTDPKAKEKNFDDSRNWRHDEVLEAARAWEESDGYDEMYDDIVGENDERLW